eukprot:TRINITY_DN20181_c0_g1_i1.p1 TRINITY_DN20181_c0_g1~~TRINITY_DN20181_c0_g1_i1.p1  ORF type:complete len:540 (+),score=108.85 TRINITY_DN20181_c0_g1_i1:37-1656(+)
MSLLRPLYWSDKFFDTPVRQCNTGYPANFDCLFDAAKERQRPITNKDRYELLTLCMDEAYARTEAVGVIRRAVDVLCELDLSETDLGLLIPTVLCPEVDECVRNELARVYLHNQEVTAILLTHVLYRPASDTRAQHRAALAIALLVKIKNPLTRPFVAYTLSMFLRSTPVVGLNTTAAKGLQCFFKDTSSAVPYGMHLVRRCFEVGRIKGGLEGYKVFAKGCRKDADMTCEQLWKAMQAPAVKWGHTRTLCLTMPEENDLQANIAVALFQLDVGAGSHGPRFDSDFVDEGLQELERVMEAGRAPLTMSQAIPLMDALNKSGKLQSERTLLLVKGVAAALRYPQNAQMLYRLAIDSTLLAMLKSCLQGARSHVDPMDLDTMHTAHLKALLADAQEHQHVPHLSLLLSSGLKPPPASRAASAIMSAIITLLAALLESNGPCMKSIALAFHAKGYPPLLASIGNEQGLQALYLLSLMDPTFFADYTASNPDTAYTMGLLISKYTDTQEAFHLIKVLANDVRSRKLLFKSHLECLAGLSSYCL